MPDGAICQCLLRNAPIAIKHILNHRITALVGNGSHVVGCRIVAVMLCKAVRISRRYEVTCSVVSERDGPADIVNCTRDSVVGVVEELDVSPIGRGYLSDRGWRRCLICVELMGDGNLVAIPIRDTCQLIWGGYAIECKLGPIS